MKEFIEVLVVSAMVLLAVVGAFFVAGRFAGK